METTSAERRARAKHFLGFCATYFSHYFYREPAPFHFKLAEVLQDDSIEQVGVIGFRGSAKSTFASLAYILWCALEGRHRFIILIGDTQQQMKLNLSNIKYELENNEALRKDYGAMYDPNNNWSGQSLLLTNDVLILGRSRGQKVRGMRHREFRPELIVIDDPEDLEWVKKKENRDKTERWLTSEVIPAQREDKSKLVMIGNLLHNDCLLARLKRRGTMKMLEFPLFNKDGTCSWKALYPTQEAIDKQKAKVGSETTWSREYLLRIISEEDQIVKETDIRRYDVAMLSERNRYGEILHRALDAGVGIDLAISEKAEADYTAIVSANKVMLDGEEKILILPNPIIRKMGFYDTQKVALQVAETMPFGTKFFVEDVGYQKSALQGMAREGLSVQAMRPISDKRARVETIASPIKGGKVLFPETGCEDLIAQLVNFGIEEHDDAVDALVYVILGLLSKKKVKAVARPDRI